MEIPTSWITPDATLKEGGWVGKKSVRVLEQPVEDAADPYVIDERYKPIIADDGLSVRRLGFRRDALLRWGDFVSSRRCVAAWVIYCLFGDTFRRTRIG